ncbi:hypothetical protein D3C80_1578490 [compost metagenome]
MVVGQQIAFRAHDHRRTQAGFHAPLTRQVVAKELAKLLILEHGVSRLADELGGVQVGYRRRGRTHRGGVGHRTFLCRAIDRRLA